MNNEIQQKHQIENDLRFARETQKNSQNSEALKIQFEEKFNNLQNELDLKNTELKTKEELRIRLEKEMTNFLNQLQSYEKEVKKINPLITEIDELKQTNKNLNENLTIFTNQNDLLKEESQKLNTKTAILSKLESIIQVYFQQFTHLFENVTFDGKKVVSSDVLKLENLKTAENSEEIIKESNQKLNN